MNKGNHERTPMEFSKKIMIVAGIIDIAVTIFALVMVWRIGDLTPLCYIVPAKAAEIGAGTGFYYNKAKVENRIKLMAQYDVMPSENAFNANF